MPLASIGYWAPKCVLCSCCSLEKLSAVTGYTRIKLPQSNHRISFPHVLIWKPGSDRTRIPIGVVLVWRRARAAQVSPLQNPGYLPTPGTICFVIIVSRRLNAAFGCTLSMFGGRRIRVANPSCSRSFDRVVLLIFVPA